MENQAPQTAPITPQVSDSNPIQEPTPKKSKLIYIFWGMLVLLILTIGTSTTIYISKSLKPKTKPNTSLTKQISTTPNQSINITSWKTYTDPGNKFTITYPPNLDVEIKKNPYLFMTGKNSSDSAVIISRSRPEIEKNYQDWYTLTISSDNNPKNLTEKELLNNYLLHLKDNSTHPNDQSGKFIADKVEKTLKNYNNHEIAGIHAVFGFDYDIDQIIQVKNGKVYEFMYTGDNGGKVSTNAEKEINEILSTFKFKN